MLLAESLLGSSSVEPAFIEDVFSTWLYTGNGSTQTINNGIDLAGKGGLVWLKNRTGTYDHWLWDTSRGAGFALKSNTTAAQANIGTTEGVSFTSSGFSFGNNINWNASGTTAVSWTFREQPKFFDIVTYTGNGANRTIAHSLGSVPGCIMVKRTDTASDWQVWHRAIDAGSFLVLNTDANANLGPTVWNSTTPTATVFSLGTNVNVNASGGTYVAYLFAHNAGGFGASGAENVISCGSYTGESGQSPPDIILGWEPQWILVKATGIASGGWCIVDNMRGLPVGANVRLLRANLNSVETVTTSPPVTLLPNGFRITGNDPAFNYYDTEGSVGGTYLYIAIRRGPMRTPTSGTSVFSPITSSGAAGTTLTTNFPVDMMLTKYRAGAASNAVVDRLRGVSTNSTEQGSVIYTNLTAAEAGTAGESLNWNNTGFQVPSNWGGISNVFYSFRRAPGFFDMVCYTGNSTNNRTINHNLTASPELTIIKMRSGDVTRGWRMYAPGAIGSAKWGMLNLTNAFETPAYIPSVSSTTITLSADPEVNRTACTYVAYLFASAPGVSKVGSYTGTGATQTINCGFSSGARFVLIKRTDSTGDWYVWDSARGIVAGNDPYLLLNSTAAEVTNTDWVDTAASGFELSNAAGNLVNTNGASYIFLAIA